MRIFRYISYLLVVLAFGLVTQSCSTGQKATAGSAQVQTVSYAPTEKALLWKIEGKALEAPSYLYGTIHMIDKEDFYLPAGTDESIEASETMVFEIDMAEMTDMGAQMGLLARAFMADGTTLGDLLSEEDYQLVKDYFADMGLPLFMLERIQPMFLSVFVGSDMDPFSMQEGDVISYEFHFFEEAEKRSMETGGLETMEYQMSMFDSIPYEAQAEMLVEAIEMANEGTEMFDAMVELYTSQDIQGMIEMTGAEEGGLGDYETMLLTNRNRDWIPRMENYMSKGPVFFAVGAGHLAGEDGVIALLRKQGYTVTPISMQDAPNN